MCNLSAKSEAYNATLKKRVILFSCFILNKTFSPVNLHSWAILSLWSKSSKLNIKTIHVRTNNRILLQSLVSTGKFLFAVMVANNSFVPNEPFLYPLKTSENLIFWGCRKSVLGTNGLMQNSHKELIFWMDFRKLACLFCLFYCCCFCFVFVFRISVKLSESVLQHYYDISLQDFLNCAEWIALIIISGNFQVHGRNYSQRVYRPQHDFDKGTSSWIIQLSEQLQSHIQDPFKYLRWSVSLNRPMIDVWQGPNRPLQHVWMTTTDLTT